MRRADDDWGTGQVHRRGASRWSGGGQEQGSERGLVREQAPGRRPEGDSVVIVGRNAHKSVVQAFNQSLVASYRSLAND